MTNSEIIKDYRKKCEEAKPAKTITVARGSRKPRAGKTIEYEVLLSKGTDCIIEKRVGAEKSQFVFLPSEDSYFIKKEKNAQPCDSKNIEMFFRDLSKEGIRVGNIVFQTIKNYNYFSISGMIRNYAKECKEGIMSLNRYTSSNSNPAYCLSRNRFLWEYLAKNTPFLTNTDKYNYHLFSFLDALDRSEGFSAVESFLAVYLQSSMTGISPINNPDVGGIKELSISDMAEYLCYTLYEQGYRNIPISTYLECLKLQQEFYHRVFNPYPKSLLAETSRLQLMDWEKKRFLSKKIGEKDLLSRYPDTFPCPKPESFAEIMEASFDLGYSFYPDLIKENTLIYFRKENGKATLWFLVEKKEDETYQIVKAEGKNRRTKLTKEEEEFLKNTKLPISLSET